MSDSIIAGIFRIGAAIVTAIIGPLLVKRRALRKSTSGVQLEKSTSDVQPEPTTRAYVREQTPRDVLLSLQAVPPLSRANVARETYHHRWVKWAGTVQSITVYPDSFTVSLVDDSPYPCWTLVDFPHARRADIELLREGDHVIYEAQIRQVWLEGGDIKLQDGHIIRNNSREDLVDRSAK